VVVSFKSEDEILKRVHSKNSYGAIPRGAVCNFAVKELTENTEARKGYPLQ